VQDLAERAYFELCRVLGRLLRAGRYAKTEIVDSDGGAQVRKQRLSHAPLLIALGGPLMRVLDTGVRILPQRDWERRERELNRTLGRASVRIEPGGVLVLPFLPGRTLAALLEDPSIPTSDRKRATQLAVTALAELHRLGFTHADAMAENVMVDLTGGAAHWFDFETVHEASRPLAWSLADDVRALLASCLLRTAPQEFGETLQLVLDVYRGEEVARLVASMFTTVIRRPLPFHLGQAGLSYQDDRQIALLLRRRVSTLS
jgi:hypothetical protein